MVSSKRSSSTNATHSNTNGTGSTNAGMQGSSSGANSSSSAATMTTHGEGGMKHTADTCNICTRYKEGERVLCFEPDPTKVRVVYDAKILQISVSVSDEKRGKHIHEFLVHFQGWNASWDRFVPQSFLLKVRIIQIYAEWES